MPTLQLEMSWRYVCWKNIITKKDGKLSGEITVWIRLNGSMGRIHFVGHESSTPALVYTSALIKWAVVIIKKSSAAAKRLSDIKHTTRLYQIFNWNLSIMVAVAAVVVVVRIIRMPCWRFINPSYWEHDSVINHWIFF